MFSYSRQSLYIVLYLYIVNFFKNTVEIKFENLYGPSKLLIPRRYSIRRKTLSNQSTNVTNLVLIHDNTIKYKQVQYDHV